MFNEENSHNWHDTQYHADMVNADCVHDRWLDALCPIILVLFDVNLFSRSFYECKVVYVCSGDNFDVFCVSVMQQTTFKWKGIISVFSVLQGSAETLIRWGEKMYHLPIACCLRNISAKNYQNQTTPARVIVKNVGGVFYWDTVYIWIWWYRDGVGNTTEKNSSMFSKQLP